ncbi:hypothetical protein PG985_013129 [Apiospora marii]|uniref:uncharacterized protein n=1 Tax=Apiospora marii TaxID=335849 RepID=UPI00312D51C6
MTTVSFAVPVEFGVITRRLGDRLPKQWRLCSGSAPWELLEMRHQLGVSGGDAPIDDADLLRRLARAGADVVEDGVERLHDLQGVALERPAMARQAQRAAEQARDGLGEPEGHLRLLHLRLLHLVERAHVHDQVLQDVLGGGALGQRGYNLEVAQEPQELVEEDRLVDALALLGQVLRLGVLQGADEQVLRNDVEAGAELGWEDRRELGGGTVGLEGDIDSSRGRRCRHDGRQRCGRQTGSRSGKRLRSRTHNGERGHDWL